MITLYFDYENTYFRSFEESNFNDFFEFLDKAQILPISLKGTRENKIKDIEELEKFLRRSLNILLIDSKLYDYYYLKSIYKRLENNPTLSTYVVSKRSLNALK